MRHTFLRVDVSVGLRDWLSSLEDGRLQWPHGLRHEPSTPAQTLGWWVRIPLEEWMSLCICSVFVLCCVQVAALRRADTSSKKFYKLRKDQETESAAKVQKGL
jgi:hypothetical protein